MISRGTRSAARTGLQASRYYPRSRGRSCQIRDVVESEKCGVMLDSLYADADEVGAGAGSLSSIVQGNLDLPTQNRVMWSYFGPVFRETIENALNLRCNEAQPDINQTEPDRCVKTNPTTNALTIVAQAAGTLPFYHLQGKESKRND